MPAIEVVYPLKKALRNLYKPDASGRQVSDGVEELVYETSIDLGCLDTMARKAARSVGGKSTDGPLKVRILSRKRL